MAGTPAVISGDADDLTQVGNDAPVLTPITTPPIAPLGDDYEIVEVDGAGKPLNGAPTPEPDAPLTEDAGGDKPLLERQARQEQGTSAEREQGRNARRRARQKEFRDKNSQENIQLRQELARVAAYAQSLELGFRAQEPRFTQIEQTLRTDQEQALTQQIQQADADYNAAVRSMGEAMRAQDPDALETSMTRRDNAVQRKIALQNRKERMEAAPTLPAAQPRQAAPQQQQFAPPQFQPASQPRLSARALQLGSEFMESLPWLDRNPQSTDLDTVVLRNIDASVEADGYDPNTDDYWDELESRAAQYLPHRFPPEQAPAAKAPARNGNGAPQNGAAQPRQAQTNVTPLRRGPATAGGAEQAPKLAKNQVLITPDRKSALIATGALNDDGTPHDRKKLDRLLREYANYDRAHPEMMQR
jgi:hypothetical protein